MLFPQAVCSNGPRSDLRLTFQVWVISDCPVPFPLPGSLHYLPRLLHHGIFTWCSEDASNHRVVTTAKRCAKGFETRSRDFFFLEPREAVVISYRPPPVSAQHLVSSPKRSFWPAMDTDNPNQRAASQSSIRSANTRQGHIRHSNTFQGFSRPGSQRPPLRAVDNNATLLRAPGPLESMLKTTTETGDIGFFTIGASASSDTYHQPQRLGPSLQDVPLARSARSRRQHQQNYFQDDRLQLPSSYRDTTSEILSLYGSEAHQSRTFTPSNEDVQRSYSLTTCSSRHIPSHKSSATLQSLSSTSGVQRPRSPFPYPTRLKRPGTRPASPAVTDNGTIDYNRALELDRSHQVRVNLKSPKPTDTLSADAIWRLQTSSHVPLSACPSSLRALREQSVDYLSSITLFSRPISHVAVAIQSAYSFILPYKDTSAV